LDVVVCDQFSETFEVDWPGFSCLASAGDQRIGIKSDPQVALRICVSKEEQIPDWGRDRFSSVIGHRVASAGPRGSAA
jgi:hypothetical protein